MESLFYISEGQIGHEEASSRIASLVEGSLVKNARLNLTGALLFTGTHFVQILEGPNEQLDQLMRSIERDIRHTNVTVIDRGPITTRQFPKWGLAYFGPSNFVSQRVLSVLNCSPGTERRRMAERLRYLISELAGWRPK